MQPVLVAVPPKRGRPFGAKNWTVDDPPQWIADLVDWYAWERAYGEEMKDYAEKVGIKYQNIVRAQRDPRFIQMLEARLRDSNGGPMKVQAVLDMLHRKAVEQQDERAAKVYLEAVGKMAPRHTTVDVTVTDARSLSDEQLHAELRRAITLLETRELPPRRGGEDITDAEVIEDTEQGKM